MGILSTFNGLKIKPMDESLSMDQIFIRKLTEIVLAHLSDEKFNVEELVKEAGLSSSTIHRRLHSLTNKSVSQFIREIRLNSAMEMLQKNMGTISEVAYKTGFGSPTYFNKCFHEFFGYPPGKVKKGNYRGPEEAILSPVNSKKKHKRSAWRTFILSSAGIILFTIIGYLVSIVFFQSSSGIVGSTMTMTVSVMNENGERENRRIFKDEYVSKISLFPFLNESDDSLNNWLQYGISEAISLDLLQFNYISLEFNRNTIHLQEQIKYAKTNNYPYFLTGVYRVTSGIYEITTRLYQTTNGTIKAERVFKGNDFFTLIDSISLQTRNDLNIAKPILNSFTDLPVNEQSTYNLDAFRYYARAMAGARGGSINSNLNHAIQLDSTFALALYSLARRNFYYQRSYESAQKFIIQTMRHRQRLSENLEISTRIYYYLILGENDKAIALSEMQQELQPSNIQLLLSLINTYETNFMVQKLERSLEQLNELLPNIPAYQILLARSYLFTGKLDKGLEVLKQTLKDNPENTGALLQMGEIYLHKNDLVAAGEVYKKAILLSPEDEQYWSKILTHIAFVRNSSMNTNSLEPFTGNYRYENSELSLNYFIHNNYLVNKAINQFPIFVYPVSNNQFTWYNGFIAYTLLSNNQGKVINFVTKQRNLLNPTIVWKEDSLILNARNLLSNGEKAEALSAFRRAYDQNPEHYYLANFIQHLEFIQSREYEKLRPVFDSYSGEYGGMKLYKDKDRIYYKNAYGEIYLLLPLNKSQFMVPSKYNTQIQIIKEKDSIKGLKFIYRDGKEEFFSRNN